MTAQCLTLWTDNARRLVPCPSDPVTWKAIGDVSRLDKPFGKLFAVALNLEAAE